MAIHFLCFFSDVDVKDPDEKSIMTYVAQFLQYSNDMPSPDDHLQVSKHVIASFFLLVWLIDLIAVLLVCIFSTFSNLTLNSLEMYVQRLTYPLYMLS